MVASQFVAVGLPMPMNKLNLTQSFAGAAAVAAMAVGAGIVPAAADSISVTSQNGHLTEWIAGYNAAEYEVGGVNINGYRVDGIGAFEMVRDDGSQLTVWCIQADVGHSTTANYQPAASNLFVSAQLDYLTFMYANTTDDATATAVQSAIWYFVNAVRSSVPVPIWGNGAAGFAPITPDSPDSWVALPTFDYATYPVGLLLDGSSGRTDLDSVEALVAQVAADANLLQGPWVLSAPAATVTPGEFRAQITSAWNAPVPSRTVTFTLPDGSIQTALTDASGYATIVGATGFGTLTVEASAPGTHIEFAASGVQRVVGAGTPTTIRNNTILLQDPQLSSTASDQADGDQLIAEGATAADSVPITQLTIGNSYTLHGQLYDTATAAFVGTPVSTTFTALATEETHALSTTVPAGTAGHHVVWIVSLDDNTSRRPGVVPPTSSDDLNETLLVAPTLTLTTDAGPALTVPRGQSVDMTDSVTLTGLAPAFRATAAEAALGTVILYGPFPSLADAVCVSDTEVGSSSLAFQSDGTVESGTVTATPVWYDAVYTWVATVVTSQGRTITHACGLPSESPQLISDVTADVHLRKTISGDGTTWHNSQKGTTPAYDPTSAPSVPATGSHDDQLADAGDGLPVFPVGAQVSFQYEVWLDPASTGWATWADGITGAVTDDNGTPADSADDFAPAYVAGDDGDGFLELGEVWLYEAHNSITAKAGDNYLNYSTIPAGKVVDPTGPTRDTGLATTPRTDPAGYVVPACSTLAVNPVDQSHVLGVDGGAVHDTTTCSNLVPGVSVTVTGELQARQPDGSVTATGIVGSSTFIPAAATATTVVVFTVPPSASPGTYVVFETLSITATGKVLGGHHDPTDADQTILKRSPILTIPETPERTTQTSSIPSTGTDVMAGLRMGSVLAGAGVATLAISRSRRRRRR